MVRRRFVGRSFGFYVIDPRITAQAPQALISTFLSPMKLVFRKELAALFATTSLFGQSPPATGFDSSLVPLNISAAVPSPLSEETQYSVVLATKPLSAAFADALAQGRRMSDAEQRAYVANLRVAQAALSKSIASLGGREIARVGLSLNAIFISASPVVAKQIVGLNGVRSVLEVVNLHTQAEPTPADFKEVIPLIGANTLRDSGIDGTGVRVAVLDSGIDYTHAAFGGAGTADSYRAAYGTSAADARNKDAVSWPQGRVVGGFDFVGEQWPNAALAPDPDPIGAPPFSNNLGIVGTDGNHGTSVADIIAGGSFSSRPDNHGVAPGASLYAVKVCSAMGLACSGIAVIQGIEWSLDPDGDGSLSDAVDVINLSLGADYGQRENISSEAVANAARAGVVVCCAAGNAGDNPYIVSSPSIAPEVISVAQTSQPSAKVFILDLTSTTAPSRFSIRNTNTVAWAPIVGTTTGTVVAAPTMVCSRLAPGTLAGKIALIDPFSCNISTKVAYAQAAGAIGVILVNGAPGDPPSFGFGGIPPDLPADFTIFIPTIIISSTDGATLRAHLAAGTLTATLSDTAFISRASSIASTSSRGPSLNLNTIKPEIGAPGANLAAVSGSGTGFAAFGGTSGASPVIAGSAALIRQQNPRLSPLEVKARLMNNASSEVFQNPVSLPGQLAPISRVGAGEVRVLPAVQATSAAWVVGADGAPSVPALSFGYWRLSGPQSFTQTVRVKNYSASARTFTIANSTRFSPGSPGAVTVTAPGSISVAAGATADFTVALLINPANLPVWNTDSGLFGADGPRLAALEYGGFITLSDRTDTLGIPWQILPQKTHRALVSASTYTLGAPSPTISNTPSSIAAVANVYSLTGTSPRLPAGSYPALGDNFTVTDLQNVGVRVINAPQPIGPVLEFAITTWSRHTHANAPSQFVVTIDVDRNGSIDWFLFTQRLGASDNRNATFFGSPSWPLSLPLFPTTVDFNSSNVVLQVPLNRIGLTVPQTPSLNPAENPLPLDHPFSFTVLAFDNYFATGVTDAIGPMTYTAGQPKYRVGPGVDNVIIPAGGSTSLPISPTGFTSSTSQSGILLLFPNGRTNFESKAITATP